MQKKQIGIALVICPMAWFAQFRGRIDLPTLSQVLPPLDETSAQPLYQQLQRALRDAIENRVIGPDDALPPERDLAETARCFAHHGAQGHRRTGGRRPADTQAGFRHLRQQPRREELREAHLVLRGHARARPRATQRVAEPRRGHGDTRRSRSRCVPAPARRCYRFHRIRYADDAPMALEYATVLASCLPSLDAVETSLYEALENNGNRPVRALQRLRAVLLTAEQAKLLKAQETRCRVAGRARRLSQGWPRGGVFAVLLPRRHLRLRGGAQRSIVNATDAACSRKPRRRPTRGARAARAECRAAARARRATARGAAARRGDLRARQLGSRRDLRPLPHRSAHRACSPPRPRRR